MSEQRSTAPGLSEVDELERLAAEFRKPGYVSSNMAFVDRLDPIIDRLRAALHAAKEKEDRFDFLAHLERQREFSLKTFGPGQRTAGVCDHIRKELKEIEADPDDAAEWFDVIILGLDGAWRAGLTARDIIDGVVAKQAQNELRKWPDWRNAPLDQAIEHIHD